MKLSKKILTDLSSSVLDKPEEFFTANDSQAQTCLNATKAFFDHGKKNEPREMGPLNSLLVDGFDQEQIWEQIILQSEPMTDFLEEQIQQHLKFKIRNADIHAPATSLSPLSTTNQANSHSIQFSSESETDDNEISHSEDDSDESSGSDNDTDEHKITQNSKISGQTSTTKDISSKTDITGSSNFEEGDASDEGDVPGQKESEKNRQEPSQLFSMENMELFSEKLDEMMRKQEEDAEKEEKGDDDYWGESDGDDDIDVDLTAPMATGDVFSGPKYQDFFGESYTFLNDNETKQHQLHSDESESEDESKVKSPKQSELKMQDEGDGESEVDDNLSVSRSSQTPHQKQQEKMKEWIVELEEMNLADRSWDLMGEASAKQRPRDSLLETFLDFEHAGQLAPIITEEVTKDLEDIIKERIVDENWDDVERKVEPKERPFKRIAEVSSKKSEIGLGELYEKEYVQKATGGPDEEDVQLDEEHKEIGGLFSKLCYQLDSLTNFHFTPKPPREEIVIRTDVPAILMEEAIPVGVSDAQTLAPEEIYGKRKKAPLVGETELSTKEKKKRRRTKKNAKKKKKQKTNSESRPSDQSSSTNILIGDERTQRKQKKEMIEELAKTKGRKHAYKSADVDFTNYSKSSTVFAKLQENASKSGGKKKRKFMGDGDKIRRPESYKL